MGNRWSKNIVEGYFLNVGLPFLVRESDMFKLQMIARKSNNCKGMFFLYSFATVR